MRIPTAPGTMQLLVFVVDGQRNALPLGDVVRVLRCVEVTPLPRAPAIVLGVIDVAGEVVPVLSLRRRFGASERPLHPDDAFVLVRAGGRALALVVDRVEGVVECDSAAIPAARLERGLEHSGSVTRLDDGLLVIHDVDGFLHPAEQGDLDEAMRSR